MALISEHQNQLFLSVEVVSLLLFQIERAIRIHLLRFFISTDKKIYAGKFAKNHPERYKNNNITISSIKNLIGKQGITNYGWWEASPEKITAFILAELKCQAECYLGEQVTEAVIAVPSYFDITQIQAVKNAGRIAGINVLNTTHESVAALLAYGCKKEKEEKVVVFDIGSGKLDIAVGEIGGGVIEVKSISGEGSLGGNEFTQVIVDYILAESKKSYGHFVLDPFHHMILREAVERAKIDLSLVNQTFIKIPGFFSNGNKYHDLDILLDRQTFESLAGRLFNRSIELCAWVPGSSTAAPSTSIE